MVIFLPLAYSVRPPAIAMSCSTVIWPGHRVAARARHLTGDEDVAAVDLPDDDGDVRVLDELGGGLGDRLTQLVRPQAGRLDVAHQRQRDVAVRTDGDVTGHVGVAPEHDAQHVVGANHVVGRHRRGRCRRRRRAGWRGGPARAGAGGRARLCRRAPGRRLSRAPARRHERGSAEAGSPESHAKSCVPMCFIPRAAVRRRRGGPGGSTQRVTRSKEQEPLLARGAVSTGDGGSAVAGGRGSGQAEVAARSWRGRGDVGRRPVGPGVGRRRPAAAGPVLRRRARRRRNRSRGRPRARCRRRPA